MSASVISARLDLLIRLYDTTTGAEVEESNVLFLKDAGPVRPERRGTGTYIFINTGREDFLMHIKAFGFEEYEIPIEYASLDERLPVCDVFLMPSENTAGGRRFIDFKGNLPFLKTIEAVNLNKPLCSYQAYDPKKNIMSVYYSSPSGARLSEGYYGLVDREKESYEKIEVTNTVTYQSFKLRNPLPADTAQGAQFCRIIYGNVKENGDYLLRVRNDGSNLLYMVRYQVGEDTRFQIVDFNDLGAYKLQMDLPEPEDGLTDPDSVLTDPDNDLPDSDTDLAGPDAGLKDMKEVLK